MGTLNTIEQSVKTIEKASSPFYDILCEFPEIKRPVSFKDPPKYTVFHHKETTGPPVHARVTPLPPHRYAKVKDEFKLVFEMGIFRPSKSPWASPLHECAKKMCPIRPSGDYRALTTITKLDRYPIPRFHDFTYLLAGEKVFSKL